MVTQTRCARVKEVPFFDVKFVTAVDLNKCLKQIKLPISIHTCANISKLPSDKNIMLQIFPKLSETLSVADPDNQGVGSGSTSFDWIRIRFIV